MVGERKPAELQEQAVDGVVALVSSNAWWAARHIATGHTSRPCAAGGPGFPRRAQSCARPRQVRAA